MKTIVSNSADETLALAKNIGRSIKTGFSIALTGDLGAGKTTFVQGLAKGLGVPEAYYITSPTFTILNTYPAGRLTLCHLDLYRLADADELEYIGFNDLVSPDNIIVVEWPGLLKDISFTFDLEVKFDFDPQYNRIICVVASGQPATNLLSSLIL